jgi:transposase-like protein
VLFIDGIESGRYTLIVPFGIDRDGKKHVLGLEVGNREHLRWSRPF